MKKKMFATVAAGLALSGVAGVGLSAALSSPADATTTSAVSTPATTGPHPLRAWLRAHRQEVTRHAVRISAETIGITPPALVSALRSGQSIAQVAQAHGVAASTVVDALVRAGDAKVTEAVNAERLTQALATRIESALPKLAARVVDHARSAPAA
jgi:hypothetical protein